MGRNGSHSVDNLCSIIHLCLYYIFKIPKCSDRLCIYFPSSEILCILLKGRVRLPSQYRKFTLYNVAKLALKALVSPWNSYFCNPLHFSQHTSLYNDNRLSDGTCYFIHFLESDESLKDTSALLHRSVIPVSGTMVYLLL